MRGLERQRRDLPAAASAARARACPPTRRSWRSAPRARCPREAFAYIAGGAGTGATMRANRAAFDRRRIVPRMLRDVVRARHVGRAVRPARCRPVPARARSACSRWSHRDADLAVARAAAARGRADGLLQPGVEADGGGRRASWATRPRWFQLYWSTSDELVESFVARAEACGCEAIVVTLDTTLLGWRTRDLDLAYLPFLRGKGIAQYTSDPVFNRLVAEPPTDGPAVRRAAEADAGGALGVAARS